MLSSCLKGVLIPVWSRVSSVNFYMGSLFLSLKKSASTGHNTEKCFPQSCSSSPSASRRMSQVSQTTTTYTDKNGTCLSLPVLCWGAGLCHRQSTQNLSFQVSFVGSPARKPPQNPTTPWTAQLFSPLWLASSLTSSLRSWFFNQSNGKSIQGAL